MKQLLAICETWIGVFSTLTAMLVPATAFAANTAATISLLPRVRARTLIADDATLYTVTMTATDGDGYDDIRAMRVLFNYTESGGDPALGRGQLAWGDADADINQYGGTWVIADATGGGRWGYRTEQWGGTSYLTPRSCQIRVAGSPKDGTGRRTVTFTFTVKPAWAFNPVMNDADGWIADHASATGWRDGTASFDVVSAPCTTHCATPQAPVLSNPTPTTINVAIHPANASEDAYAIMISPNVGGRAFVQKDGSLGLAAQWQTPSDWGTKTIRGLIWNTSYSFRTRAFRKETGWCPSKWGPTTRARTTDNVVMIDASQGKAFSPWVRGQCPYRQITEAGYEQVWDLSIGAMARGLAGGFDADTYDWRDITSGANWGQGGGQFTTLQFLQYARDHQAVPMLNANAFGGGARDKKNGTFHCVDDHPETLAADWVRYCNVILQNCRQGDEARLTGEDLRVHNAIRDWGGKPKLLTADEKPVPRVQYWEIGNEIELGGYPRFLTDHRISPKDYRDRYKRITRAMKAVDPALKFGPALTNPSPTNRSGEWVSTLAADPAAQVDFISYHPYYSGIKQNWGNTAGMTDALRGYKEFLNTRATDVRTIMAKHGRTNYDLIASEWNPVNWDAPGKVQNSMAQAMGVVEGCFTFAEDGVLAATFWEQPQNKLGAGGAFAGLVGDMGDILITSSTQLGLSPADINFRIYVTGKADDSSMIMIWGLNFDEKRPVTVRLALSPCRIVSATLKRYGQPGPDAKGGDTSLMDASGMAWEQKDVTAGLNAKQFQFTIEDAEITLLVLQLAPATQPDHD